MQALEAENAALADDKRSLEEQLETRRWVDRAKGKLMDDHQLSESQAFSFIQQTSMNRRTTMREVAKLVVDGSIVPEAS
jgi:response regulator NasT